ncbi:MAG: Usg family protein [Alphaproteobacteria bacterium]|nr:Usg family protein [Alphaproteobacteria bacterium]
MPVILPAFKGYRLTTAEILYHMPDYLDLLQSFALQRYDVAPGFPVLRRFLDFWRTSIQARIHSVRVSSAGILGPANVRDAGYLLSVH